MHKSIQRLFTIAGAYKWHMVLCIVLAVFSVTAGIIPYFLVRDFLIQLIAEAPSRIKLYRYACFIGISLSAKSLLFIASTTLSHKAAYRILYHTRMRLAHKLTRLPLGYVLDRDTGVIKKVMENDVEELERFLAHNIPETVSSALVPFAVTVYLFLIDWRMTLALLFCVSFAVLFYLLMMRGSKEKMRRYYDSVDFMNAVVVEYVNGMKEIKTFNQGESSLIRFREAVYAYKKYVLDWFKASWPYMSAYFVLIQSSFVTVLPFGLYLIDRESLSFSTFTLFLLVSLSFAAPLIKLAQFADSITMVATAEQNIYRILSEPELTEGSQTTVPADKEIRFQQVFFSYDGATDVLKDVSFTVKEGSSLAIVGESGGGKSTIAKLLCRFWDVRSGSIQIGGVNIHDFSMDTLMKIVSFVFQDTFLFNISIADNIRIGKQDATNAEIIAAAKAARCHDFIMEKEQGYDTLVGDDGCRLSGGERQRIAIARAILKDAPILVLDEATANIDPDCEEHLQAAISALAKGKTLIVIAHRIRTIIHLNSILVISGGKVIAQETHSALLKDCPTYQSLFSAYKESENWALMTNRGVQC